MENSEKMFSFTAAAASDNCSLKMSQLECMKPPTLASASKSNQNQSNFFDFQQQQQLQEQQHHQEQQQQHHHQQQQQQQQLQHYTISSTTNDPFTNYTDNFDLSLLPQDCAIATPATTTTVTTIHTSLPKTENSINTTTNLDNIPTTVYNFDQKNQEKKSNAQLSPVPEIKIEQTWSSCPSLNTIKQEQTYQSYFPFNAQQQQLIQPPPPAYPTHIYPSPQSSPAQSEYGYPQNHYTYDSLNSSRTSLYTTATSPCPSIDVHAIKQEQLHILPPSPPESNCDTPTPQSSSSIVGFDFKSEPFDSDAETYHDLKTAIKLPSVNLAPPQDYQVLREYLQDTTFQKEHNLKPLALDSFIGGLAEVRDNFEPVISLALEHAKREADATCAKLQISQNPSNWSTTQVHAWLRSTLQQFELPRLEGLENQFNENGVALLQLSEEEFARRVPEGGSLLHAQLEIWKLTYSDDNAKSANENFMQTNNWMHNTMTTPTTTVTLKDEMEEDTEDEDDFPTLNKGTASCLNTNDAHNGNCHFANENVASLVNNTADVSADRVAVQPTAVVVKRAGTRNGGSHIHLWQFLKELLAAPHINGTAIRWIDRTKGIFKIEDSVRVAKLWGKRKNRPAMNYDKLSRSIRQYYKKGIMKKTERSQRLVYQFCQPYHI